MTGASRGFGRCVAEEFVRQVAPASPVDLVLVARSEDGLRSASDAIDEMARSIRTPNGAADVVVRRETLDLGDLDQLEASLEGVFSRIGEMRFADSRTTICRKKCVEGWLGLVPVHKPALPTMISVSPLKQLGHNFPQQTDSSAPKTLKNDNLVARGNVIITSCK